LKTVAKLVKVEEELSKNVRIFGLPETDDEEVKVSVGQVFVTLGEKPRSYPSRRKGAVKGVTC
jgi:hypothetical protein